MDQRGSGRVTKRARCLILINARRACAGREMRRSSLEGAAMSDKIDVVELAHDLTMIASTTSDPETGRQLMEVVEKILRAAGLPPAHA
jgi:hypothetical protein